MSQIYFKIRYTTNEGKIRYVRYNENVKHHIGSVRKEVASVFSVEKLTHLKYFLMTLQKAVPSYKFEACDCKWHDTIYISSVIRAEPGPLKKYDRVLPRNRKEQS